MSPFPDLVQHYYPLLTRYARRIIHNERAAEELLPSIFNQLYIALPELHTKKQLHNFLSRAIRLACQAWLLRHATMLSSLDCSSASAHTISTLKNQCSNGKD